MSWSESLIKLATYEVETRQKRLAEVVERRVGLETRLALLAAEGEAESMRADSDPAAGMFRSAYMNGLRMRMAEIRTEIVSISQEEQGARDALAQAFEEQKKYEQVAETARTLELKEAARLETAAMDELGVRKAGGR
jgi:flagellar FliJ protein